MNKTVVIVGGGPSGLFCAYLLLKKGYKVDLYDQSSGLAKKFLVAGKGGLNLTHSEDLSIFKTRYGERENIFEELLKEFSPSDLRNFCSSLGAETFIGSSGRVFPTKMKAAQILLAWSKALKENENFRLHLKHSLVSIEEDRKLIFEFPEGRKKVAADLAIFALGGGSWSKTGSDGRWVGVFQRHGVEVSQLKPMNCGFNTQWSQPFKDKLERFPLKNVRLSCGSLFARGEAMVTDFGIEGGAIYALSGAIRRTIEREGEAKIMIDLKPDVDHEKILEKLKSKKNKVSWSNHLRKTLGFSKKHLALFRELTAKDVFEDVNELAFKIKNLPLKVVSARPLEEAISSAGGIRFESLDKNLQIRSIPGWFVAGEMLDFEAPTGGYLLQGCFSTSFRVTKAFI